MTGQNLAPDPIPEGYQLIPWAPSLTDAFAQAKYLSFRNEIDAGVFPCLAEFEGCRRLMREITRKPGFLPEATWLVVRESGGRRESCGTVQGIRDRHGLGAIQNLGVVREHRQQGLGASLLLHALAGFQQAGIRRVYLEVTAQNDAAICLYRRLGFTTIRTVYKAVEAVYSS